MLYTIKCKKCGKEFTIECSEQNFKNDKYNHYCSIQCRNSHIVTEETKLKISKTLKTLKNTHKKIKKVRYCKFCGKPILNNDRSLYCCNECKEKSHVVPTLIKYYTFNATVLGTEYAIIEYERVRQMLYDDYWINNLTSTDIAKKYNYKSSTSNICGKLFKYLHIPSRTLSEATKLNYLNGKISIPTYSPYKANWHTTWDNKKVFLRSSYELDYAVNLDNLHIKYEVETLRILYFNSIYNTYKCAIPDFYLPDINTIVEIKSIYTLNVQEMKDKFKLYNLLGYNSILIVDHIQENLNNIKEIKNKKIIYYS